MTILDTRVDTSTVDSPALPDRARLRAALLVAAKVLLGVLVTLLIGELMSPIRP